MTRRADASMSLLGDVAAGALEPEYRTSTGQNSPAIRLLVIVLVGVLLATAVAQRLNTAGDRAQERRDIVTMLEEQNTRVEELNDEIAALDAEVEALSEQQDLDPALLAQIDDLELRTGTVPVTGPGVVAEVNDAPGGDEGTQVLASDLNLLVNGLRQAGAEAVAINGLRLTTTTPIRSAGSAITVDYVSLSPPYTVEAIGDPDALQAGFGRTGAASWWLYLAENFGIRFELSAARGDLGLPAVPRTGLDHSTKGET